jgi:uroporphyrin-III C-methyltransferase/precorrin-2 dehydrogenase/sirohydrochlorin ferrochelatase/uroporphyrin-III C-methyltransferase
MAAGAEGFVSLVGAGPGDPDLISVKALKRLQAAEVVVYDRLLSQEILDLIPVGVTRIFVGKARGQHSKSQDETNALLVKLAQSGRRVVRLKGGDPFVFGRGSEEAEHLALNGISFELVPGVTAASGCAARLGIPLTHRGLATGVRFVTGHCREDQDLALNWKSLADPDTTLVFYMALANLRRIATELMAAGLPAETPAAAIAGGTLPKEDWCLDTLAGLPDAVRRRGLEAPVLIVVGRVVALADVLGAPRLDRALSNSYGHG